METTHNTAQEFEAIHRLCLQIYTKKLKDYGTSWRIMRLSSLTDQIYIKARRIRSLQEKGLAKVNEGIAPEFIGIVNYGLIALIQAATPGYEDLSEQHAIELYEQMWQQTTSLMSDKNHDYDEAWRGMRVSSFDDIILSKLRRIKQIEDHDGHTLISEGVEAGYMDIVNYSIFALIQLGYASGH